MQPLVVAAIAAEAAYVPEGMEVLITGVGKTLAAVAMTRAICEHPQRDELVVINIGTAGALREGVTGVHEIGTVLNHDLSAEAMDELVRQAQERLDRLGVRPPLDDPQRLLLSFLVVCGELQESQKKVEELKELAQKAETFSEKLAQLLEISDIH